MDSIPQKACTRCKLTKPLTDFGKYRSTPDGLHRWCKVCCAAWRRSRPSNEPSNQDKRCARCGETKPATAFQRSSNLRSGLASWCKACCRAYVYDDPDYRAHKFGYNRARYEAKRDEILAKSREYHADPVVHRRKRAYETRRWQTDLTYRARKRAWNSRDKRTPRGRERSALYAHRRRDRQRGFENTLTRAEWRQILHEQQHKCLACGRAFDLDVKPTRDHVDPNKGLSRDNCQALCGPCNSSKGARHIDYRPIRQFDFGWGDD